MMAWLLFYLLGYGIAKKMAYVAPARKYETREGYENIEILSDIAGLLSWLSVFVLLVYFFARKMFNNGTD